MTHDRWRVAIQTSDGGTYEIADFDAESALDLKQTLNDSASERFLTVEMGGGTVLLNRDHVVAVEFDFF